MTSCENATDPEKSNAVNSSELTNNVNKIKESYRYNLVPCYPKLPDTKKGKYSFDLEAYNLEPGFEYYLEAEENVPVEVVCPYTITDEYNGVTDKNGYLKLKGVIDLAVGYTIYLFRIDNSETNCFHTVLKTEKILF